MGLELSPLTTVGDMSTMEQIQRQGVKAIWLNVGAFTDTVLATVDEQSSELRKRVVDFVEGLWVSEEEREHFRQAENLQAQVIFKLRGRSGTLDVDDMGLLAARVQQEEQDDDDMRLMLGDGSEVRHGDVVLRKPVNIEVHGKTVRYGPAWDAMADYLDELRRSGALEQ